MSRLVFREPFRAQEVQGVVESRLRGGRYLPADRVPEPARLRRLRVAAGRDQFLAFWEARKAVKGQAATLAVQRTTPEQVETIRRSLRMIGLLSLEVLRATDISREFHLTLARACGNPLLEEMGVDPLLRSQATGFRNLLKVGDWAALRPVHQPVLDAVLTRARKRPGAWWRDTSTGWGAAWRAVESGRSVV